LRNVTTYTSSEGYPVVDIDISDISSITPLGRREKYRESTVPESIGYSLIVIGLGTLSTTAFVEERGEVLAAGVIELAVGAGLASISHKRYILSEEVAIREVRRQWHIVTQ
jgi:hypothetical protein